MTYPVTAPRDKERGDPVTPKTFSHRGYCTRRGYAWIDAILGELSPLPARNVRQTFPDVGITLAPKDRNDQQ